jgi:hypothetical protein
MMVASGLRSLCETRQGFLAGVLEGAFVSTLFFKTSTLS